MALILKEHQRQAQRSHKQLTRSEQVLELVAAEGMSGHGHLHTQGGGHEGCHLARIRVVPMHSVQLTGRVGLGQLDDHVLCMLDAIICELPDVGPQLLLPAGTHRKHHVYADVLLLA